MKVRSLSVVAATVVAVSVAFLQSNSASKIVPTASFASPAAQQEYAQNGDMSKNMSDAQMVCAIHAGRSHENFTATFSCTSGCTANCTRSCSNCCSHQCNRGY